MCHAFLRDASFWSFLFSVDCEIAERRRAEGCSACGGPLHSAHYLRKPRGVEREALGIELSYRLSLCCGREGCRRRATPRSVRFLGPKVYLGVVVVLVTAMRQGPTPPGMLQLQELFGADRRTIKRWQNLWEDVFPESTFWRTAKARFMPPPDERALPRSLLERFWGVDLPTSLQNLMQFLAPITIRGGLSMPAP